MKRECKECSELKNINEFPKRDNGDYRYECKVCTAEWQRQYRKEKKLHIRYQTAVRNYGITYDEAIKFYSKENCDICNKKFKTIAYIDHDHETGLVRGTLCHKCNSAIGYFNDDVDVLMNAITYLNRQ